MYDNPKAHIMPNFSFGPNENAIIMFGLVSEEKLHYLNWNYICLHCLNPNRFNTNHYHLCISRSAQWEAVCAISTKRFNGVFGAIYRQIVRSFHVHCWLKENNKKKHNTPKSITISWSIHTSKQHTHNGTANDTSHSKNDPIYKLKTK